MAILHVEMLGHVGALSKLAGDPQRRHRMGDAAQMAILELVDYNEVVTARAEEQKEKRDAKAKEKAEKAKAEQADQLLEQQASEPPVK